jgi:hypothetical protein
MAGRLPRARGVLLLDTPVRRRLLVSTPDSTAGCPPERET